MRRKVSFWNVRFLSAVVCFAAMGCGKAVQTSEGAKAVPPKPPAPVVQEMQKPNPEQQKAVAAAPIPTEKELVNSISEKTTLRDVFGLAEKSGDVNGFLFRLFGGSSRYKLRVSDADLLELLITRSPKLSAFTGSLLASIYVDSLSAQGKKLSYTALYIMVRKMEFKSHTGLHFFPRLLSGEVLEKPLVNWQFLDLAEAGARKIELIRLCEPSVKITLGEYLEEILQETEDLGWVSELSFVMKGATGRISDAPPLEALIAIAHTLADNRSDVLLAPLYKNPQILQGATADEVVEAMILLLEQPVRIGRDNHSPVWFYTTLRDDQPALAKDEAFIQRLKKLFQAHGRNLDKDIEYADSHP